MVIAFDVDYDLTSVASNDVFGNSGATVARSGNALIITLGTSVSSGASASLVIYNIKNPAYAQTTDAFSLQTKNAANGIIDQATSAGITTTAGSLSDVSVRAISYIAGDATEYTFEFTPVHNAAAGGYLRIDFDSAYDASSGYVVSPTSIYSLSSATSNSIILNLLQTITSTTPQVLRIGDIANPNYVKDVSFTLTTQAANHNTIDTTTSPTIATTPAPLAAPSVSTASSTAQDVTSYTIGFTTANAIEVGGKIEVSFDTDYDLSLVGASDVSGNSGATVSVSGDTLIVNVGTAIGGSAPVSLVISNIKNPGVQATDTYNIITRNASGYQLDYGTAPGRSIIPGALTFLSTALVTTEISESTNYSFGFTLSHALPVGGYVRIEFDDDYTLDGAIVVTAGYLLSDTGADYLLLQRTGSELTGAQTIELANVVNPSFVQTTDAFNLTTQLPSHDVIDAGTVSGIATTSGALANISATAAGAEISAITDYTITFTTDHAIGVNGKVVIGFDADYDLSLTGIISGNTGATVTRSGSSLIVTLGTALSSSEEVSLVIYNIKNPAHVQTTDNLSLMTKDAADELVDQGSCAGITTTAGALSNVFIQVVSPVAGSQTQYTFNFMPAHEVPVGGYFKIDLDSEFDISSAYVVSPTDTYSLYSREGNSFLFSLLQALVPMSSQSLRIGNVINPGREKDISFILTTQTPDSDDIDTVTTPSISITAGALTATSVTTDSYTAFDLASYTFSFTAANAVEIGDKVELTFDTDYDLSEAAFTFGNEGATLAQSDNILTVTLGTAIAKEEAVALTISDIRNPGVQGTTGYSIATKDALGNRIDTGSVPGKTITAGSLSELSVTPASSVVGATTNYTFEFTPDHIIPPDGCILITFDADYNLISVLVQTSGYQSSAGSGYVFLTNKTGAAVSGPTTIELVNITNPTFVQTTTSFFITTMTLNQETIDTNYIEGIEITPSTLSNISVSTTSSRVGDITHCTISFAPVHSIPSGGKVHVGFDSDYSLSSVNFNDVSGNQGASVAVAGDNQTLIITLGTMAPNTQVLSLVVSDIINPSYVQTTEDFFIQTRDVQDGVMDEGQANGVALEPGTLTNLVTTPQNTTLGATVDYVFQFTPEHIIPENGYVHIVFDYDYDLSSAYCEELTYSLISKGANFVLLKVLEEKASSQTLQLRTIKNPNYVKTTNPFTLTTKNTNQDDIDTGQSAGITTTPGQLSGISITAPETQAGATTSYTVAFTTVHALEQDGKVQIAFDADYDLTNVGVYDVSGNDGSTVLVSANTLIITIGTPVGESTSVSLVIADIKNPSYVKTTDPFTVTTKTPLAGLMDEGTVSGIDITAGTLNNPTVTPLSTEISKSTTYTFAFTCEHPVPAGGYIRLYFDADYQLDSASIVTLGYSIPARGDDYLSIQTSQEKTGALSLEIKNIVNPAYVKEISGFMIVSETPGHDTIDMGTASGFTTTPATLVDASISASLTKVDATCVYTINFTPAHSIDVGGEVRITFDADYDLNAVGNSDISGNTGSTVTVASNRLIITLGTAVTALTEEILAISDIQNPPYVQVADDFFIQTRNSEGKVLNEADVTGITTSPGALSAISVTATSLVAGMQTDYTFNFTPEHELVVGSYVRIDFDSAYDASLGYVVSPTDVYSLASTATSSIVLNISQTLEAGVAQTVTIDRIINPTAVKEVYFTLTTQNSNQYAIDTGISPNISTQAAPLEDISVSAGSYTALDVVSYTIGFTTVNNIEQNGRVEITFDSDYDLTQAEFSSGTINGAIPIEASLTLSGNKLFIILATEVGLGDTANLVISNIKNPGTQTTDDYFILTRDTLGRALDQGQAPGSTITIGALSNLTVTTLSAQISATTNYTFGYTVGHSVPANGYVKIEFDEDYSFANANILTPNYTFAEKTETYVLLKTSVELIGSNSIELGNTENPAYVCTTDPFVITTELPNHDQIDIGTTGTINITPGLLTGIGATAPLDRISALTDYTFTFTPSHLIEQDGKVKITFDSDFDLSSISIGTVDISGDGSPTVEAVSDNQLTIRLGTGVPAGQQVSLGVSNVINPGYVQTTQSFLIQTTDAQANMRDQGPAQGITTTAGDITDISVVGTSYIASAQVAYTFNFTPSDDVPAGGCLTIDLDSEFDASYAYLIPSNLFNLTSASENQVVLILLDYLVGGTPYSVGLGNIVNPGRSRDVIFTLTTKNSGGYTIDTDTSPSVHIEPAPLESASISADTYVATVTATYTISFVPINAIDKYGRVEVEFDVDYDLSSAQFVSGNYDASLVSAGNHLIITLGTQIQAGYATSLVVSDIKNPGAQTTEDYTLITKDSLGNPLDEGTIPGMLITGGDLTDLSVTGVSTTISETTAYTFGFTCTHPVPVNGYVRIDFDADYFLDNTGIQTAGYAIDERGSDYLLLKTTDERTGTNSITIGGIRNPSYAQTTDAFTISTQVSSQNNIETGSADGIEITAGSLTNVVVTADNYVIDEAAVYTIAFTSTHPIDTGGKVAVTFDSDYDLSAVGADDVSGNNGSTVAASDSTLIVTLGTQIFAQESVSLVISDIVNPPFVQTTDEFSIQTKNASDGVLDQGQGVGVSLSGGSLINPSASTSNAQINNAAIYTFTFTLAHTVPVDGYIKIEVDSDYDLTNSYFMGTGFAFSKGSDYFMLKATSELNAQSDVEIIIGNVKNPVFGQTTDDFMITTQYTDGSTIDTGVASGIEITAGVLANCSVTSNNFTVGEEVNYTVAFTTVNAVGVGGRVEIVFDSDYDFSALSTVSGNTGAALSVSGDTIIVTLGTAVSVSEAVTLTISALGNPSYVQTTEAYDIQTFDASGNPIDLATVTGNDITVGALENFSVSSDSSVVGEETVFTFGFTATHAIPINGYIKIELDAEYDLSSSYLISGPGLNILPSGSGYILFSVNSQLSGNQTIIVGGIKNPSYEQTTDAFVVTTQHTNQESIDTATTSGLPISAGILTDVSVTPQVVAAGALTDYAIEFTTANAVEAGGKITIVFDADYDLTQSTLVSPAGTIMPNGNILTITLTDAVAASTPLSISLSNITNPAYAQTTDIFSIETNKPSGVTIDKAECPAIVITPVVIAVISPTPEEIYQVGDTYTVQWQVVEGAISDSTTWKVEYANNIEFSSPTVIAQGIIERDVDEHFYFSWLIDQGVVSETAYIRISNTEQVHPDVKITSESFSIRPAADFSSFVSPVATDRWAIGSNSTIEWITQGKVTNNFKIEYSVGGAFTTIYEEGATGSDAVSKSVSENWYEDNWSYTWVVPDVAEFPSANVRIRVTNLDDSRAAGSSSIMEITYPYIVVTSPAAGEVWVRNETNDIIWEGYGDTGDTFRIEYSSDGGVTYSATPIYEGTIDNVEGVYAYSWTIAPEYELSEQAVIRVDNIEDERVIDESEEFIVNLGGILSVTAPEEADAWVKGCTYEIKWNSEGQTLNQSSLRIEYSIDDFVTSNTIIGSTDNDGSFTWNISNSSMSNVKVRITQIGGNEVNATSGAFDVLDVPTVEFLAPVEDLQWNAGLTKTIKWRSARGVTKDIIISYSTNGGLTYPNVIFDYTTDNYDDYITDTVVGSDIDRTYSWQVPLDFSDQVKIKIKDKGIDRWVEGEYFTATSDEFSIIPPTVTIEQPIGGEEWIAGTEHDIIWIQTGDLGQDIKITYSTDGGATYPHVIFDNSSGDPVAYQNKITISGTGYIYRWTVSDTISDEVRVKVEGITSTGSGASVTNFSIVLPTINILNPTTSSSWAIFDTAKLINWTTTGNVSDHLRIEFFKDETTSKVIVADTNSSSPSYSWDITEDFADYTSVEGWIKITDLNSLATFGEEVSVVSENFSLQQPHFTIDLPAEVLITDDTSMITWSGVGDYAAFSDDPDNTVMIKYSTDDFQTSHVIINSTQNDGAYGPWTVPDAHSANVKLSVTHNLYRFVTGASSAFKIQGLLSITAPTAQTKFYVGQQPMIEWDTTGTINKVDITYSKDGGQNWQDVVLEETNNGFYYWTIPNAVLMDRSPNSNVYFRIEDATDSEVYATRKYTVSYYKVIWNVTDADGLIGDLDALEVLTLDITDNSTEWESRSGLDSGRRGINDVDADDDDIVLYYYPGHLYQTTWTRDAYLPTTYQPSPWQADQDGIEMTVRLATKQVLKKREVFSEIAYDAANDTLRIQCWLQEEEKLLTELAGLEACYVDIYDDDAALIKSFVYDASESDQSGVFWTKWLNTGLLAGRGYFARFTLEFEGAPHYGGRPFDVTEAKFMLLMQQNLDTGFVDISTDITQSEGVITGAITSSESVITTKIETEATETQTVIGSAVTAARTSIESKVDATKTSIEDKVTVIGATTQAAIATAASTIEEKVRIEALSRILNEEGYIKTGETLPVRYQTATGVSPEIDVYDPDNRQVISKGAMEEIAGTEGVYGYDVNFIRAWGTGTFTIVCSESTHGTIDGISLDVIRADLEDIHSAAVVSMGQLSSIDTSQLQTLSSSIGVVSSSIEGIVNTIGELGTMSGTLSELAANIKETVFEQLSAASEKMKEIATQQELKLDQVLDVQEEGAQDLTYLKQKTLDIKATTEITHDIIERTSDVPVTKTWLSPGSILMNMMVVNPSSTKTQKATLKAYLPEEIMPEDIVELEDLSINYDVEKGLYYVFKEYELGPGEMVKRQIELKDVWVISEEALGSIWDRAVEITKALTNTSYFEEATVLKDGIERRRGRILDTQRNALDALPDKHIATYRDNVKLLEIVKSDLAKLENMLLQAKPAVGVAAKKIHVKASWWVIMGIVIFLSLLSFALFVVWHKQAKTAELEKKAEKTEEERQVRQE